MISDFFATNADVAITVHDNGAGVFNNAPHGVPEADGHGLRDGREPRPAIRAR